MGPVLAVPILEKIFGGGDNSAKATSTSSQTFNGNIVQSYAGSCSITCNNSMTGASLNLNNSYAAGDAGLSQSCTVNGQCLLNSVTNALADALFKAQNSAGAEPSLIPFTSGKSSSSTFSYQSINDNIIQTTTQTCNVSSTNDMNNVSASADSSYIGGNFMISQTGNVTGGCTLSNMMSATEKAQGFADNCSEAGKSKACGGLAGSIGTYFMYAAVAIGIFIVIMVVIRLLKGPTPPLVPPSSLDSKLILSLLEHETAQPVGLNQEAAISAGLEREAVP